MDATITAALIGGGAAIISGGWTALVAITSTRSARRTNQATIDAAAENTKRALDAAHEERIWEKRADAYLDAMRFVRHRRDIYDHSVRSVRWDDATEKRIKDWISSFQVPDWRDIELRLLAYASQTVINAMNASGEGISRILQAGQIFTEARRNMMTPDEVAKHLEALDRARKEADGKDEALLAAIRDDLHSRPSQAAALPPGAGRSGHIWGRPAS